MVAMVDGRDGGIGRGGASVKLEDDAVVFHAGTAAQNGETVTAGGRVLCVTTMASTVKAAQAHAYAILRHIDFAGAQYRRDIGHRALKG